MHEPRFDSVETASEGGQKGLAAFGDSFASDLHALAITIHALNYKWWVDLDTGEKIQRNVGELIALMHSELSEALEAHRKNLMDDKLPQYPGVAVEFADAIIRILDAAVGLGHSNIGEVLVEKLRYNVSRIDHTHEHRRGEGGKKY